MYVKHYPVIITSKVDDSYIDTNISITFLIVLSSRQSANKYKETVTLLLGLPLGSWFASAGLGEGSSCLLLPSKTLFECPS